MVGSSNLYFSQILVIFIIAGILFFLTRVPAVQHALFQRLAQSLISTAPNIFPEEDSDKRDLELEKQMDLVLSTVTMGRALRAKHQLKIRQPLPKIFLVTHDPEAKSVLENLGDLISDELNVKDIVITPDDDELVNF